MDKNKEKEVALTKEEVWNVLQFAQNYMNVGSLFPQLTANRVAMLQSGSIGDIDALMKNQSQTPTNLAEFSQALEMESQIYRKLISYLSNMLSFDYTYSSKAYDGKSDYTSFAYKKDLSTVEDFFIKFDHKKIIIWKFKKVLTRFKTVSPI